MNGCQPPFLLSLILMLASGVPAAFVGHVGNFLVEFDGRRLEARHAATGVPAWASSDLPFVAYGLRQFDAKEFTGNFKIQDDPHCATDAQTVAVHQVDDTVVLAGNLTATRWPCKSEVGTAYTLTLRASTRSRRQLQLDLRVVAAASAPSGLTPRLTLRTALNASDAIFGLGVQYSVWNLRGRVVPMLVSEQGIGRGLQPLTELLNAGSHGAGGNWHTTYTAIPHYITSSMRASYLENTEYCLFDLTADDYMTTHVYSTTALLANVVAAASPMQHVEEYTIFSGRQPPVPAWATQGPIIGYEGGTEAVLKLHARLKAAGIPVAGYWLQDWSGTRVDAFGTRVWWNWEWDEAHYPNSSALVRTLQADGARLLAYVNPYLANTVSADKPHFRRDLFKEAAARGLLVRDADGQPYIQASGSTTFTFGTVDLTSTKAAAWYAAVIRENMLQAGISGYMADFGEYLPFDALLSGNQSTAAAAHNEFPALWAATNQLAASGRSAEVLYFLRSGHSRSPGASPLFWLGDQLVTYDAFDGLQTTLYGRFSGGLSGFGSSHSDLGGYTMVDQMGLTYVRSKELLLRWMEASALADSIFRSHPGNLPNASWQVYTDDSTLNCFARMASLHRMTGAYRQSLMQELSRTGAPVVRHMWLHYPDDSAAMKASRQFLLGPDVLVAPALEAGQRSVTAYIPAGNWTFLWDGRFLPPAANVSLPAPIGQPPVVYRSGSSVGAQLRHGLAELARNPCVL